MFGAIGRFFSRVFSAVAKFFANLAKDPLKTIMFIVMMVIMFFSLGTLAPALMAGMSMMEFMALGAAIGVAAIGLDWKWLQIALTIIAFAVSFYNLAFNWSTMIADLSRNAFTSGILSQAEWSTLAELSFSWRAVIIGIEAYATASALVSIRDDTSLLAGAVAVAAEVADAAGELVGGVIGGFADGLLGGSSSFGGVVLIALGCYVGYRVITRDQNTVEIAR